MLRVHGPGQQESLGNVALRFTEGVHDHSGLDALADDSQGEVVPEVYDRAHDRGMGRILEHVEHKALVDLQFVNRKSREIAEALAVTTYTNIINTAPFFARLASDDQGYLKAAREEEMSHYLLEEGVTRKPSPFTTFYYPPKMFADAQTTLNVLVTLEDAFIAAYLVGVRDFSTADLRVTAARIMGIESDHRTLARVVAPGVAAQDGGPVERVTGIQNKAESVDPPNNNGYERTLGWTSIHKAVEALTPFADKTAAAKAGFDTGKAYKFEPFAPKLPEPLGEFHSFLG